MFIQSILVFLSLQHFKDFGLDLKPLKKLLYQTYASFNAGDPISHGVHAGLFGVRGGQIFECIFASSQFVFPKLAAGLAEFDEHFLGVLTSLDHCFGGRGIVVTIFISRSRKIGHFQDRN